MAGRGLNLELDHTKARGLRDRLESHWQGRRSGDQFCVYVCDRLTAEQIARVATGELKLDLLTRDYIRQHLSYRFCVTETFAEAFSIETRMAKGQTVAGWPLLNPNRGRAATRAKSAATS